ncbi:MAG TPA: DUF5666 domain-containing protein, partial [Burkholderiales bacterium]
MRRLLAALSCAFFPALAGMHAHACTDPGGIGGTGIGADGGGIGGTGMRAQSELDVLGVITGFASICVNGIEVHYDASTPVSLNGTPAAADALGIGQVVAVSAVGSGTQARARAIHIVDSAVGALGSVDPTGSSMQVAGERVRLHPSTVLGGGLTRERLAGTPPGETLRVSGLRAADGTIVATRIEPAPRDAAPAAPAPPQLGPGRVLVQGYVAGVQGSEMRIGALAFEVAPGLAAQLASERLVRVAGRTEGGRHIVERADLLAGAFDVRPERTLRPERPRPRDGDDRGGRS